MIGDAAKHVTHSAAVSRAASRPPARAAAAERVPQQLPGQQPTHECIMACWTAASNAEVPPQLLGPEFIADCRQSVPEGVSPP